MALNIYEACMKNIKEEEGIGEKEARTVVSQRDQKEIYGKENMDRRTEASEESSIIRKEDESLERQLEDLVKRAENTQLAYSEMKRNLLAQSDEMALQSYIQLKEVNHVNEIYIHDTEDTDDNRFESLDMFARPNMPLFNGKDEWKPYFLQFSSMADEYQWPNEERLFNLIQCLRDKALKYFGGLPTSVHANYKLLCQKLGERFGRKEEPHIIRRDLQNLRQEVDETIEEFADRAEKLAVDGYPDIPEQYVNTLATDAFLRGCKDKSAALVSADKNPRSLKLAVEYLKGAMANRKIMMGGMRSVIKKVTIHECDSIVQKNEELNVRMIHRVKDDRERHNDEGKSLGIVDRERIEMTHFARETSNDLNFTGSRMVANS